MFIFKTRKVPYSFLGYIIVFSNKPPESIDVLSSSPPIFPTGSRVISGNINSKYATLHKNGHVTYLKFAPSENGHKEIKEAFMINSVKGSVKYFLKTDPILQLSRHFNVSKQRIRKIIKTSNECEFVPTFSFATRRGMGQTTFLQSSRKSTIGVLIDHNTSTISVTTPTQHVTAELTEENKRRVFYGKLPKDVKKKNNLNLLWLQDMKRKGRPYFLHGRGYIMDPEKRILIRVYNYDKGDIIYPFVKKNVITPEIDLWLTDPNAAVFLT